jgi:hypothetical protein
MLPWPIRICDLSCLCSRRGDSGTSGMNWCVVRPLLECSHLACHMSQVLISSYCLMCRREIKSLLEMRSSMKGAEFIYLFFSFTLPSQFFFIILFVNGLVLSTRRRPRLRTGTGRFFFSFPFYCSYLLCPRSLRDFFSLSFIRLFLCGEAEDGLGLCFRFPKFFFLWFKK